MTVVRITVTLDAEAHRRVRERAAEQEISFGRIHPAGRRAGARRPKPRGAVHEIFRMFNSGGSNIAKHKDVYIAEALGAARPERTSA